MLKKRLYLVFIILLFCFSGYISIKGFIKQNSSDLLKLNLGLELVGGSSITLEADFHSYKRELYENLVYEIKKILNINEVFFNDSFLSNDYDLSLNFSFNQKNFELLKKKNLLDQFVKFYKISFFEKEKKISISLDEKYLSFLKESSIQEAIKNISRRIDSIGNKEITIEKLGDNKLLIQAPGFNDPKKLKYLVGKTGKLSFHIVDDEKKNDNIIYLKDENNIELRLIKNSIIDGKLLKNAHANISQNGKVTVNFSLNNEGSEKFDKISSENIGKRIAIVIDNVVLSAPLIRERISGGAVEISGSFDYSEASSLAAALRSGALPIGFSISEERLVGATSGNQLIKKGSIALIAALIMVGIFVVIVYGMLGVVAVFGILLNISLIICTMIISESVLSLAGVAGLILTVGIIVDNNVLIFERINDELKINNKSYIKGIINGFDKAFITIIDSNITTIISASLLFFFGDNNLRSFALTLIYGIAISFFSTIWVCKVIIENYNEKILKNSFLLNKIFKKQIS